MRHSRTRKAEKTHDSANLSPSSAMKKGRSSHPTVCASGSTPALDDHCPAPRTRKHPARLNPLHGCHCPSGQVHKDHLQITARWSVKNETSTQPLTTPNLTVQRRNIGQGIGLNIERTEAQTTIVILDVPTESRGRQHPTIGTERPTPTDGIRRCTSFNVQRHLR